MTAQTATIADFLLARIAEDEEAAEKWSRESTSECWNCGGNTLPQAPDALSPDRVLAECEAKRRIVELHALVPRPGRDEYPWMCAQCGEAPGEEFGWCPWPCDTVRALARIYADHPDFREEWRA